MLRLKHGLFALLATISLAVAQIMPTPPQGIPPEVLAQMRARGAVPPSSGNRPGAPQQPSQELQRIMQLQFDRRPSAYLRAWVQPELLPIDEDPEFDEEREKLATLEAEAEEAAAAAAAQAEAEAEPDDEPDTEATSEPATPEGEAQADAAPESMAAASPNPETTVRSETPTETEGDAEPEQSADPEPDTTVEAPAGEDALGSEEPVADAEAPAGPAEMARPAMPPNPELAAMKQAYEAKKSGRKLEMFQRDVTLGRWERVGEFLAELPEQEGPMAYQHLLNALPHAPMSPESGQVPPNLRERNTFSFVDVLGILRAAPEGIEKADRKTNLQLLAVIVQGAIGEGHATEELLRSLRTESAKPEGEGALTRRDSALLLAALAHDADMGEFLPSADEATAANDREALNLLSRFHRAWYAKEQKTIHLERAWTVTQAALAAGEVEEEEKLEALKHAVELAPRIRKELGEAWLAESFTVRPERGMEIIAALGSQASRGFETHPADADFRLKGLQLQKTAVDALLKEAPEHAESWRISLNLLAGNWLVEAGHSAAFSQATTMGPRMRRDSYGNIFYSNHRGRQEHPVKAIEPAELLKIRPGEGWVAMLDVSVKPRCSTIAAELYLKVGEETKAFPYIEALAPTHPEKAKELAEEFLRVWTRNHNPNVASERTNPYMFIYGFDQRRAGIPLTRSKQERNLAELAIWLERLRALPIGELDQKLVINAFTASHSTAEVYRLEAMEKVFGSLENLEPQAISEMVQKMRANLVGVWRQPATQKQMQTQRKQKDIQREVLGGYRTAHRVITSALDKHPDDWRLHAALAALAHDQNNYQQAVTKSSGFSERRSVALEGLQRAAELYAQQAESRSIDDETAEPYLLWFYAALGACDLQFIDSRTRLDHRQPARIRAALEALPGEARDRHMVKFANAMFTRMSAVDPSVKVRYLKAGFEIVGDHPQAYEARKVFDYYNDLVTEIKLEAVIDGDDVVGYQQPFGVRVNLRHTREIERESGGFAKYLTNQSNRSYAYNYGRPLENYRDRFQEAATQALEDHFEVLSVTFNSEAVHSKASEEYGWRITPYAYLLLKARGPEVDRLPPLQIDLDFLDTSGYAVIPVASAPVPLDASVEPTDPRPYHDLQVQQLLDERRADQGRLVLEIRAAAKGLVPELDDILDLAPGEFDVAHIEDQGVQLSQFDDEQRDIESERSWMISMTAKEGLTSHPDSFAFGALRDDSAQVKFQRYADADLVSAEAVISLERQYGDPSPRWPWFVGVGALLLGGLWFGRSRFKRHQVDEAVARQLPESITPFSVLDLLRDIERDNHLSPELRRELGDVIEQVERHYFGPAGEADPDLERIAEVWLEKSC